MTLRFKFKEIQKFSSNYTDLSNFLSNILQAVSLHYYYITKQLNFSDPELLFTNFWKYCKKSSGSYFSGFKGKDEVRMKKAIGAPGMISEWGAKMIRYG